MGRPTWVVQNHVRKSQRVVGRLCKYGLSGGMLFFTAITPHSGNTASVRIKGGFLTLCRKPPVNTGALAGDPGSSASSSFIKSSLRASLCPSGLGFDNRVEEALFLPCMESQVSKKDGKSCT